MKKLLLFISFFIFAIKLNAQCGLSEKLVEIQIVPDNYPAEISWSLVSDGIQVLTGDFNGNQICVPQDACLQFTINDQFGDGICCNFGNGSYTLFVDGLQIATGGNYQNTETVTTGCPIGSSCSEPILITEGNYTAPNQNYWYSFTPTQSGNYQISTCGLSTCDTKIWVYDYCNAMITNETNVGTLFYDDNEGGCDLQAVVNAVLQAGQDYMIRIGRAAGSSCASNEIDFSLNYMGPVAGCMDPSACNYNPMATVSDNNCAYFPSPDCSGGPDLMILEPAIVNSLNLRQQTATNCMVEEGCMNGYGLRTILAFDTHIKNIGDMDYYIGDPTNNPDQFTFQNCHGHPHYEGYADYILYDSEGNSTPIGHKNGFCVLDLECNDGGTAQYGCGNMGISKQCGDIYNSGLDCQWIDITDVAAGSYILAVKINWDQSPDALGRYETNYANNWGQACIEITVDAQGNRGYQLIPNCQPYVDCMGVPYGNSTVDCNGVCGGSGMKGDADANQVIEVNDAIEFSIGNVNGTLALTSCNDLSGDGVLSVWDAGLDLKCALNTSSNACAFPNSVQNLDQYSEIGNLMINTVDSYIDVYIKNPQSKVLGYEFEFSGINIVDAENLIDPAFYSISPQFKINGNKLVGMSYRDSMIPKNFVMTPLVRVYYTNLVPGDVCLQNAQIINNLAQPIFVNPIDVCLSTASVDERGMTNFIIKPNPANDKIEIELMSKIKEELKITLIDALGRVIVEKTINSMEKNATIETSKLEEGFYNVILSHNGIKSSKKLIIKH